MFRVVWSVGKNRGCDASCVQAEEKKVKEKTRTKEEEQEHQLRVAFELFDVDGSGAVACGRALCL